MTLSIAEIESWSAGDVREVFHAASSRAQAAQDAADGIATLPALVTWGGVAADAAKESLSQTQHDLTAHSRAALNVAQAARRAADNIDKLQAELKDVELDADDVGLRVNPKTNTIERKPRSTHGFRWQQQNVPLLQDRLDRIVALANMVDAQLAGAIRMADGTATPAPSAPTPRPQMPPELYELQRANDEAMVRASERAKTARDALNGAVTALYTNGPGTPQFDAANSQIPRLKAELAQALADAGKIPDFNGVDANAVIAGPNGVGFSYQTSDGRTVHVAPAKLRDGTLELWDSGAAAVYSYKNGTLVDTRSLDDGQVQATAEPLFTAVTAPLGIGPAIRGSEAAYLGLRSLFAKESVQGLAGYSSDDVLTRGTEIVAARGESAADNLAARVAGEAATSPGPPPTAFDLTTDHARSLGFDQAQGRFIAREAETGLRLEQELGVKLTRAERGAPFDYFDPITGRSYDAVGNFPSRFFDKQWPQLQNQILDHLNKAEVVPVDISKFSPAQQQQVRQFVERMANPRIIVIGGE